MHRIKASALRMKESLLLGDLAGVRRGDERHVAGEEMHGRLHLEPDPDALHDRGRMVGALRRQGSPARGGGGFVMLFVDPARRMDVIRAFDNLPGHAATCHFTKRGAHAWKLFECSKRSGDLAAI